MNKGEHTYKIAFEVNFEQLKFLYTTFRKMSNDWAGGEWWEQLMLKGIEKEMWKMIMEEQFTDKSG